MIGILLLSFATLGFGTHLLASPISGTYDAAAFESALAGSAVVLELDAADAAPTTAQEQAPEFVVPALIPEVVRMILLGLGLIFLAALWQRRENRKLIRFV